MRTGERTLHVSLGFAKAGGGDGDDLVTPPSRMACGRLTIVDARRALLNGEREQD